jgi:hypothetical protein
MSHPPGLLRAHRKRPRRPCASNRFAPCVPPEQRVRTKFIPHRAEISVRSPKEFATNLALRVEYRIGELISTCFVHLRTSDDC